jgi:Tol biopolymer transport system component
MAHLAVITPDGRSLGDFSEQIPTLTNGSVAWSPDGKYVAGYADPGGALSTMWIADIDHRTSTKILELSADRRFRGVTWLPGNSRLIYAIQTQTSDLVMFDQGR